MLTIEEAIENAEQKGRDFAYEGKFASASEQRQIAAWLRELIELRIKDKKWWGRNA